MITHKRILVVVLIVISFVANANQNLIVEHVIKEKNLLTEYKPAYYSRISFSPDGKQLAFIRDTQTDNVWASELLIQNLSDKNTRLAISKKTTKQYAAYSALAYSLAWEGGNIKVKISDGDVDGVEIIYDSIRNKIIKKTPQTFDNDFSEITQNKLSKSITKCFPKWDKDIVQSAENMKQISWLIHGKTAYFQARHVNADNNLWFLNFNTCERKVIFHPGNNKQPDFKGWLSGAAYINGYMAFSLSSTRENADTGKYEHIGLLRIAHVNNFKNNYFEISDLAGGRLLDLGGLSDYQYVLYRPTRNYCGGRLFAFNSSNKFHEIIIKNKSFCNVSLNPYTNELAIITKKSGNKISYRMLHIVPAIKFQ